MCNIQCQSILGILQFLWVLYLSWCLGSTTAILLCHDLPRGFGAAFLAGGRGADIAAFARAGAGLAEALGAALLGPPAGLDAGLGLPIGFGLPIGLGRPIGACGPIGLGLPIGPGCPIGPGLLAP